MTYSTAQPVLKQTPHHKHGLQKVVVETTDLPFIIPVNHQLAVYNQFETQQTTTVQGDMIVVSLI